MTAADAPDIQQIVRDHPETVGVIIGKSIYRWLKCAVCEVMFWKNTSDMRRRRNRPVYRAYCSDACHAEGSRRLRNARQQRWLRKAKEKRHGISDTDATAG